jgi:hypothetical protein
MSRSTGKRAGSRRPYRQREKDRALTLLRHGSIAAAHSETGIPKSTLSRWAKAAGIDMEAPAKERTAAATKAVRERAAAARVSTVERLGNILDGQLSVHEQMTRLELEAAELLEQHPELERVKLESGQTVTVPKSQEVRDALGRLQLLSEAVNKRDLVGAVGQAIKQLQLLTGEDEGFGPLVRAEAFTVVLSDKLMPDMAKSDAEAVTIALPDQRGRGPLALRSSALDEGGDWGVVVAGEATEVTDDR